MPNLLVKPLDLGLLLLSVLGGDRLVAAEAHLCVCVGLVGGPLVCALRK